MGGIVERVNLSRLFVRLLPLLLLLAAPALAQRSVTVDYTLRVDARDTTMFEVEMRPRGVGRRFDVAMARHPEYDDRFWRFVETLRVVSPAGGTVTRADSAVWRVELPVAAREATLRWRVRVPFEPRPRASWRPFLSSTGALGGGPHSFMYVVGAERARSTVTLSLPKAWRAATALPADGGGRFRADSVPQLVESPILVGSLHEWRFDVRGVRHRVVYWPRPGATAFDTARFVGGIARLARETADLFGRIPYQEYVFLFQDDAYGGLEHPSSVTLGAPSNRLARDPHATIEETAHEFVHTWNLMSIRPAEYRGVDYRPITPTKLLWFSEGLTMYYADLLARRAGLPLDDSTRVAHLEGLVARYLSNPVHGRVSPESLSVVAYNAGPEALGDYQGGVHLPGELLGAALDLIVRDATSGRRSMDDVMVLLMRRHGGAARGIGTAQVENAVRAVCGCDPSSFFAAHVRGPQRLDLAKYLALLGLRLDVRWQPVRNAQGEAPDWRVWAYVAPADTSAVRLRLIDPTSVWGEAGLHTGDRVAAINGEAVRTWPQFRSAVSRLRVGDSVAVTLASSGAAAPRVVRFVMRGYRAPVVRIELDPASSPGRRALGTGWLAGHTTLH